MAVVGALLMQHRTFENLRSHPPAAVAPADCCVSTIAMTTPKAQNHFGVRKKIEIASRGLKALTLVEVGL
jgi:hypothetical protein